MIDFAKISDIFCLVDEFYKDFGRNDTIVPVGQAFQASAFSTAVRILNCWSEYLQRVILRWKESRQ